MKATKTKSGKWRVLTSQVINGKRVRKSFTAETKREAEFLANAYLRDKKRIEKDMFFYEAIRAFIESRGRVLSPSTLYGYERLYKRLEPLHYIKLSMIDSKAVQGFVNAYASNHSPKTVKNAYGFITAVLGVYAPDVRLSVRLPQVQPKTYNVPTKDEVNKLLDNCEDIELKKVIMLAAFCALRRSEISALNYNDLDGNALTINKAMVYDSSRTWVIKPPKTLTSNRVITIPPFVADYLRSNSETGQMVKLNPDMITNRFLNYCKSQNVKTTLHNLRHWSVSYLHSVAPNVSDLYLQQFGGWSSPYTMRKIYMNALTDEQQKANAEIINAFEKVREKVQ